MSFEVKLGNLAIESSPGVFLASELLRPFFSSKVPLDIAFKFSDVITEVEKNLRNFSEQRLVLLKENGIEIKDDKDKVTGYKPDPEKLQFISEQMDKLLAITVNLPWSKFNLSDFKDVTLETEKAMHLRWLFNMAVDPNEPDTSLDHIDDSAVN